MDAEGPGGTGAIEGDGAVGSDRTGAEVGVDDRATVERIGGGGEGMGGIVDRPGVHQRGDGVIDILLDGAIIGEGGSGTQTA